MIYLVDSDWIADALKGLPDATRLLTQLASPGLAISLISYGEIYEGIYYGTNARAAERVFLQFLRGVSVLALNKAIMKRFARIRGQLRQQGQIIGDADLLIAATALHHNLILVTRNARHFSRVPGLQLY
jgi:predicted nucleic acid-binding protein